MTGSGIVVPVDRGPGRRAPARWPGAPWDRWGVDLCLAVLVAVVSLISFTARASVLLETDDGHLGYLAPDLAGNAQVVLASLALAWRRARPGLVLALCLTSAIALNAQHYPVTPLPYAVLVATYTLAESWPLRRSVGALVLVAVVMGASALTLLSPAADDEAFIEVLAVVTAWALGRGVRLRQTATGLLQERARLLEERAGQLAQQQAAMTVQAAARERASIARELHDIVANNVGVIVVRAGVVLRHDDPGGHKARAALESIEALAVETLGDMRGLVGVLQFVDGDATSPAGPCLDQLEELVAKVVAAGSPVDLHVTGERRKLPPAVELHAFRIVQESLTNTMKHAAGSRVVVRVDFQPDHVRLLVRDYGVERTSATMSGWGLEGMRQRVTLMGGSLEAGPGREGGFVVDAVLPVSPGAEP